MEWTLLRWRSRSTRTGPAPSSMMTWWRFVWPWHWLVMARCWRTIVRPKISGGWWFVKGIIWSHLCKSWYVIYLWFSRSSNRFQLVQWIQSDTVPGTLWISNLWDDVGWMFPHSRWIGTSTRVAREWSLRCNRSQMPAPRRHLSWSRNGISAFVRRSSCWMRVMWL